MSAQRPSVSFCVIAKQRIPELDRLISHVLALPADRVAELIVAVESADADTPVESSDDAGVRWIEVPAGRGLAYNRNRVIEAAQGEVLVWTDDDCLPQPGWLESLLSALDTPSISAAAGTILIPPSGFVGDSISALGFPAGGSAGFATMFPVHEDGTTDNLPSGNCAIRASVVRELGGFDESMTLGGEDTEFSYRLRQAGHRVLYCPDATVVHPARTSVAEFCGWSYRRGRAKKQFARKVPVGGYVGNRFASYGRILKMNATSPKIVLVAPLLGLNLVLQLAGFAAETVVPATAAVRDDHAR